MTGPASTEPAADPTPIGTPERPAFKPYRATLIVLLVIYAAWVGVMIVWSVRLHSR